MVSRNWQALIAFVCYFLFDMTTQPKLALGGPLGKSTDLAGGTAVKNLRTAVTKDVDGDGVFDLHATPINSAGPGSQGPSFTISGATGILLSAKNLTDATYSVPPTDQNAFALTTCSSIVLLFQKEGVHLESFGLVVADAGDVNADGRTDILTANPSAYNSSGVVSIFSGRDSTLLYQKVGGSQERLGWAAAGAGDVNNDGYADFIASALTANGDAGSVFVYSGQDGSVLYRIDGTSPLDYINSVAGAGDVNADGWDDFIIGNSTESPGPLYGEATVYSGRNGSVLYQIDGSAYVGSGDLLGFSVAGAGDVNNDSFADFVIGAPSGYFSATPIGRIFVFSGIDGSLLFQKQGSPTLDEFGMSVAGAGDANNDGYDDVVIGSPFLGAGSVFVYSGQDGTLLHQKNGIPGGSDSGRFGLSVDGSGDVDGDGFYDFIVGNPGTGQNGQGAAFVYSGANGGLIFQKNGNQYFEGEGVGGSVAGGGDINGDTRSDFIIAAPWTSPPPKYYAGTVYAYGLLVTNQKGDFNGDLLLSSADVVLMINCVFLASGTCNPCFADVDCNGELAPADVIRELNAVILLRPFPC